MTDERSMNVARATIREMVDEKLCPSFREEERKKYYAQVYSAELYTLTRYNIIVVGIYRTNRYHLRRISGDTPLHVQSV